MIKPFEENALAAASSAYLRSARHQPVRWLQWSEETFAKAQQENKPVLLDIGAIWCHWCHVMDRESYENEETAALINERFVAVKVDRDERPDVDTRYQLAVSAISGQGGWPLTVFLTPEGNPYFGGTYFPPEDRYGRPSFRRVLQTMAESFANSRSEVDETAGSIVAALEYNEAIFAPPGGEAAFPTLERLLRVILDKFDSRNGGFGSQPKFPHSSAIDLLIDAASRTGPQAEVAKQVATFTLQKMADGGMHDQLAGGFHRYSVDERWIVPHFEKMAYDNSELLKNYVHAFQTFLRPEFAKVAKDIVAWMDTWLSDRSHGGFYASQDADESLEDDGDYFTWTRNEAREILSPEEFLVTAAHYDLRDIGDMQHNPQKNVLHVALSVEEAARRTQKTPEEAQSLLASAKQKMYAARLRRATPFVDRTLYTGWNGMCISAYLEAAKVLGMDDVRDFALKSLDRVLAGAWSKLRGLGHVVAYGENAQAPTYIRGVLDDYAFLANASLDGWQSSGNVRYFQAARDIADSMLERFYDEAGGGFFDTEVVTGSPGILTVRRKPLQDAPTPSGNSIAIAVLLRLSALSNDAKYLLRAKETLSLFAEAAEQFGLYAASYGLALRRALQPATQVCIVGDDESAILLGAAATVRYDITRSVVRLQRDDLFSLPPALAETLPHLPKTEASFALVCQGSRCLPPIFDPDQLAEALQ